MKIPAQTNRPMFVQSKIGLTINGKQYRIHDEFPWESIGYPWKKVLVLYNNNVLFHSLDFEEAMEQEIGDGLDTLSIEELHALRASINEKVDAVATTLKERNQKRCAHSSLPDKQRGKIRSWRRVYGKSIEERYNKMKG